ncbi:MAG: CYTH domain-containing protein [Flavobacteriaceae bacterium]
MIEIERKFLVKNKTYKSESIKKQLITQGYLSSDPKRSVRIRICEQNAYITIKGQTSESGTSRYEWEKEINTEDAKQLMLLCREGVVTKIRHLIPFKNHTFEVDEFLKDNSGLVIAEVELSNENEDFERPRWLGKEVTGIKKYYNSQLSQNAYVNW